MSSAGELGDPYFCSSSCYKAWKSTQQAPSRGGGGGMGGALRDAFEHDKLALKRNLDNAGAGIFVDLAPLAIKGIAAVGGLAVTGLVAGGKFAAKKAQEARERAEQERLIAEQERLLAEQAARERAMQAREQAKAALKAGKTKPAAAAETPAFMFCGDCGVKNQAGAAFCGDCGSKL
ncbi:MAG: hypothetical protein FWG66_00020 [Spirochaetes bacterium]|nr:hypothetical protein [Spirochaetota bacterium]